MESTELLKLKKEFGDNKVIPSEYEFVILSALSYYPELKEIPIEFKLSNKHPVPYGTTPTLRSLFKNPSNRKYKITLLTKAKGPAVKALFKNLPQDAQIGVIGHELAHVVQYHKISIRTLWKTILFFPLVRKVMEQDADRKTIDRGLGVQLYKLATYLRSIHGYTRQRPQINIYYLTPNEILAHIRAGVMGGT